MKTKAFCGNLGSLKSNQPSPQHQQHLGLTAHPFLHSAVTLGQSHPDSTSARGKAQVKAGQLCPTCFNTAL